MTISSKVCHITYFKCHNTNQYFHKTEKSNLLSFTFEQPVKLRYFTSIDTFTYLVN